MAIWRAARVRELSCVDSSTTRTEESSIERSATPNGSPRPAPSASVGSKGDSYDNAVAEAFNSLYKTELVRTQGPWRGLDDLEMATVEYIDWYNDRGYTANSHTSHPPNTRPYTR
ncbi:hypothetical protein B0E54_04525 [Micromonospora sp. MH99]|nr:integrase core domain-containing protein [Micromonospora sp. MH99]MCF0095663.1 hypothetical protein [Micromonospora sp. MH99]